ncbi:MAG: hypothetical protein ACE145_08670 [Terriglobia bacterium]
MAALRRQKVERKDPIGISGFVALWFLVILSALYFALWDRVPRSLGAALLTHGGSQVVLTTQATTKLPPFLAATKESYNKAERAAQKGDTETYRKLATDGWVVAVPDGTPARVLKRELLMANVEILGGGLKGRIGWVAMSAVKRQRPAVVATNPSGGE